MTIGKESFHKLTIKSRHTGVVDTETVRHDVFEIAIGHIVKLGSQYFLTCWRRRQEAIERLFLHCFVSDELSRLGSLFARVHKDEHLVLASLVERFLVGDFVQDQQRLMAFFSVIPTYSCLSGHGR